MFFKSCYVNVFTVIIFSFIIRIKRLIMTHLFKRLIYEIQNNLHQLRTHMSTLIMWHNRFSENENKPRRHIYHDIGIPRPKNHVIEIPRQKNGDIRFGY